MRYLIGIIGIILSFLLVVYRERIQRFTGNFEWAERKLGAGGTFTVILLVGILGFLFSITYMVDGFDLFLNSIGIDFFGSVN